MCSEEKTMAGATDAVVTRTRRLKRDKVGTYKIQAKTAVRYTRKAKKKSRAAKKHGGDGPSGGIESILPSFIGVVILACGVMAKMGFRGRATVAGIDLGTTNSVICVQAPAKGVGEIDCIPDPLTDSPIIPSVVSFLDPSEIPYGKKEKSDIRPHPSNVVVGDAAKRRIDTHPQQTLYHAKRVVGRDAHDDAVSTLANEVEFKVDTSGDEVLFSVTRGKDTLSIPPHSVGAYVVNHLMDMTKHFLGHDNVKSAVICVPAKFNAPQRQATVDAFKAAGVTVTRIIDEPSAAALAYGLHKKDGVDYILVYDFGGGTLDVSLLHVTNGFADVMGTDGDDTLGGADFDAAVAKFLHEKTEKAVDDVVAAITSLGNEDLEDELMKTCDVLNMTPLCSHSSLHTIGEKLKIELSSFPDGDGIVEAKCMSTSNTSPGSVSDFCSSLQPVALSMTSAEYNGAVQGLFERSVLPIRRLLKDLDLGTDEVDEVVMVGGTTRMPQIRELVKKEMNVDALNVHIDPDLTVAYGAASVID